MKTKIQREIIAWFWVGLVFLLINGAIGQARRSIDFFESVSPEANRDCLIRPGGAGGAGLDSVIAAHELESLRRHVRNMESSKFWKLRRFWFRLKRLLGLPASE